MQQVIRFFQIAIIASLCWHGPLAAEDLSTSIKASTHYTSLKHGTMRYHTSGNPANPAVVLIHTFNGFLESWNSNAPALASAGYYVISYDLWGRGLSSHPDIPLTLDVYIQQLQQLLAKLNIKRSHLVGASFGAVIATEYALRHPQQVNKLVQIGPAGWPKDNDASQWLIQIPLLADAIFYFNGISLLRSSVLEYFYQTPANWALDYWQQYAELPGFTRSSLSMLRHAPIKDFSAGWQRLGQSGKGSLFIWGKQDVSFAYDNTVLLKQWVPQALLHSIDRAAHWINVENATEVNAVITQYLAN